MSQITGYIQKELLILVFVLYFVGVGLKKIKIVPDNYIPLLIGIVGIALSCLYVLGMEGWSYSSVYSGICQGILCAGMSVYANQIYKQLKNKGDT